MILFTKKSKNKKTGAIPVSTSSKITCPDACPFKQAGCYAKHGALNIHWERLTKKLVGIKWQTFINNVKNLPNRSLWRNNQAGDLEGKGNVIDIIKLRQLVKANINKKVLCYSHKPVLIGQDNKRVINNNRKAIKEANKNGFTINLSANNLKHADQLIKLGIGPVATILPLNQLENTLTPAGNRVVVCPASKRNDVTCETCRLCTRAKRKYIIGFPAHGIFKHKLTKILQNS